MWLLLFCEINCENWKMGSGNWCGKNACIRLRVFVLFGDCKVVIWDCGSWGIGCNDSSSRDGIKNRERMMLIRSRLSFIKCLYFLKGALIRLASV